MDVSLPDLSGVEATRQVLVRAPEVKVVALSVHADPQYVAGMLEAGASGYVLKEGPRSSCCTWCGRPWPGTPT